MEEIVAAIMAVTAPHSGDPVLLDGRCDRAEYRRASRTDLGQGVTLYAMHGRDFISLCASLPPESLGTMDLFLQPSNGGPIIDLHVSAQVGEAIVEEGKEPEFEWGNHRGWYGPPVAIRGSELRPDGRPRVTFRDAPGRELQLLKSRFGRGPWRMRLELRTIGPKQANTVRLPADEKAWVTLRLR